MAGFYEQIVQDTVNEFRSNLCQKIKENNTFPANLADPPKKTVLTYLYTA